MIRKSNLILLIVPTIVAIVLSACKPQSTPTLEPAVDEEPQPKTGFPNPASEYCRKQGGMFEIRTDADGNQYGVCMSANGVECEEWAYYRGECSPFVDDETGEAAEETAPRYINEEYGFSIDPPAEWQIDDNYKDMQYLLFIRDKEDGKRYLLFVGYQRADEELRPFRSGMGSGDIVDGGSFTFMGEELPRKLLVFEGKTKTVLYGARMEADDLRLSVYLDPRYESDDWSDLEIPPEIIAEADEIVASFALWP